MPSFYRPGERRGNPHWIVRGYIGGKQRELSVATARNKRDAKKAWDRYVEEVEKSRAVSGKPSDPNAFRTVAARYAETHGLAKANVRKLEKLCEAGLTIGDKRVSFGDMSVLDIRQSHIHDAAHDLYKGLSNATKNREAVVPAAAVLHWLGEGEEIPYRRIRRFPEAQPEVRRPDPHVRDLLLANTAGEKHLLLAMMFFQGWRIGETLRWEVQQRDMQRRTLTLWVPKVKRWTTVPMHPDVFELLANADLPAEGSIWPWRTRGGVTKWLNRLCEELGVEFTTKMARHEFGSVLAEKGATAADLVGAGSWTHPAATRVYTHLSDEHVSRIINLIPSATLKGDKAK